MEALQDEADVAAEGEEDALEADEARRGAAGRAAVEKVEHARFTRAHGRVLAAQRLDADDAPGAEDVLREQRGLRGALAEGSEITVAAREQRQVRPDVEPAVGERERRRRGGCGGGGAARREEPRRAASQLHDANAAGGAPSSLIV